MAQTAQTCFVVMGFGKKTDYQTGRVLDLDKSYRYIIKPAAQDAGLICKRADEIVHSGLVDVPMYDQLLTADVVIADISTSNPNAFYELGVRHALRPYTTITIAEDKMTFPFDVSHLLVRRYQHMGEGIDFDEVIRMKSELTNAILTILAKPEKDSPVYAFFSDLDPPARRKIEIAVAQSSPQAVGAIPVPPAPAAQMPGPRPKSNPPPSPAPVELTALFRGAAPTRTVSDLMQEVDAAMAASNFARAKEVLALVREMAPRDSYVLQRMALATYKSEKPNPLQALIDASVILAELSPDVSTDTETLGLWGAIHRRVWDLTKDKEHLDKALFAYEKGFYLKNDYYNGINLAFLYEVRASISAADDATADRVTAQRIRERVLTICEALLSSGDKLSKDQQYWVFATRAEAATGLGDDNRAQEYLRHAQLLQPAAWMKDTTNRQLTTLKALLTRKP